jgi:HPt (histidine-containing phosphotransfer) domain-containing protein
LHRIKLYTVTQIPLVLGDVVGYASERMKAPAPRTHPSLSRHESSLDENVLDGLHRLSRDGKPDLAKTVIMLFLETAPTTLHDLQRGAAANDRELIARVSHILSASAAAVGAASLSARCRELEAMSRSGAVPDVVARVQLIQRLYAEAESALRGWCAGR